MTMVRLNARFRGRPLTGVERFASEVTEHLARRDGIGIAETAPLLPLAGWKGHAWEQVILPRAVAGDEILFSPCNTGPLAVARQLVVIHDAAVWDGPEGFSRSFRSLYQQLLPRLAKRAAVVATVSQFSRTRLAPVLGIPEERILVLGNAVSHVFCPGLPREERSNGSTFLCVGSLDPRKNLGRLLRAWIWLREKGRLPAGAKLQLIGGANPRNFAGMERIEGSGIEWIGRVDDAELIRRYRAADAFVYPSLYEGFGLPPLEAMACGCPVLLAQAASLPEVGGAVEEGAVRYFDPGSEMEIAAAIERFLALDASERALMRQRALDRAGRFSWETIAGKVAAAMASV